MSNLQSLIAVRNQLRPVLGKDVPVSEHQALLQRQGVHPHPSVLQVIASSARMARNLDGRSKDFVFQNSFEEPAMQTLWQDLRILLLVVALIACFIPAYRATKVDPMIALRCE